MCDRIEAHRLDLNQARCQSSVTGSAEKLLGGSDKIFPQIRREDQKKSLHLKLWPIDIPVFPPFGAQFPLGGEGARS